MKNKILLAAATLFIYGSCLAQDKIKSFKVSEYFCPRDGKKYDIDLVPDKKHEYSLYVSMFSSDVLSKEVCLIVDDKKLDEFNESIRKIKEYYENWRDVAAKNGVTSLNKKIEVKFPNIDAAFYGTRWFYDFSPKMSPAFIVSQGRTVVILYLLELEASDNKYITSKGGMIVFDSSERFDEFLAALDRAKAEKALESAYNANSLFK